MTFSIPQMDMMLSLEEGKVLELIIEEPCMYRDVVTDIYNQSNGCIGRVIFAQGDKVMTVGKHVDFVLNPLLVNCNDKKILTKLYQEMKDIVVERFLDEMTGVNASIVEFFDHVIEQMPYALDFNVEFDVVGLMKLYKIEMQTEANELFVKLSDYLRAMNKVCHIDTFVFVDLKNYMSSYELEELYKFCAYEKINILIISKHQSAGSIYEKQYIIDKDLCVIEI